MWLVFGIEHLSNLANKWPNIFIDTNCQNYVQNGSVQTIYIHANSTK